MAIHEGVYTPDYLDEEELLALQRAAYNADTGKEWTRVGNTFWYSDGGDDWAAIPGGGLMVEYIVAAQPRTVLRLLVMVKCLIEQIEDMGGSWVPGAILPPYEP